MPSFLEALGQAVGETMARQRADVERRQAQAQQQYGDTAAFEAALRNEAGTWAQNIMEKRQHVLDTLQGADRDEQENGVLGHVRADLGRARIMGETVLDLLDKPMDIGRYLIGARQALAEGKPTAEALPPSKAMERYNANPAPLRFGGELLAGSLLGGPKGRNLSALVGGDGRVASALSTVEAAPGEVASAGLRAVAAPFGALAKRLGLGVPTTRTMGRQQLDAMQENAERARQVLSAAGMDVTTDTLLRTIRNAARGGRAAQRTVNQWGQAVDSFLGGPASSTRGDALAPLREAAVDTDQLHRGAQLLTGHADALAEDTAQAQAALGRISTTQGKPYATMDELLSNRDAANAAAIQHGEDVQLLRDLRGRYGQDLLSPDLNPAQVADARAAGELAQQFEPGWLEKGTQAAKDAPVIGGALQALGQFNKLYRPLALMSGQFHVNNLSDQAFKSWVGEGIHAWLHDSQLAKMLTGWEQVRDAGAVQRLAGEKALRITPFGNLTRTDEGTELVNVPKVVADGFGRSMDLAWKRVPFVRNLEKANKHMTTWMEESARLSAYVQGKQRSLLENLDDFARRVGEAAGPDAEQSVLESKGVLGPRALGDLLGDVPERRSLLGEWQGMLKAADKAGADLSTRIHFNYRYTNNLDDLFQQVLLFHTFSTRNLLYYPQILASHPGVAMVLRRYMQESEDTLKKRGLTSRFMGYVPGGSLGENVAALLYGPHAELMTNPAGYLSGVQQFLPLAKQLANPERGQTAAGALVEGMGNVGLGLTPPIEMALGATGALGQNSTPRGILPPLARQVQNAAGVLAGRPLDVEAPLKELIAPDALDLPELAIRRRIAEMAVEAGKPRAYDAFMGKPDSPIYREAARQVANAQAVRGALSFTTGAQIQPLMEGESTIRQAQHDSSAPTYDPNGSALEKATYQYRRGEAMQRELDALIDKDPQRVYRELLTNSPRFRNYIEQDLHATPEQVEAWEPDALKRLLSQFVRRLDVGSTMQLDSTGYGGTNPPQQGSRQQVPQRTPTPRVGPIQPRTAPRRFDERQLLSR